MTMMVFEKLWSVAQLFQALAFLFFLFSPHRTKAANSKHSDEPVLHFRLRGKGWNFSTIISICTQLRVNDTDKTAQKAAHV